MHQFPSAVLFDFDGVLVNSEPLHFRAMSGALMDEGIELTEFEYYDQLVGFDDRGAFRRVYANRERPVDPGTLLRLIVNKSRAMMGLIRDGSFEALPGVEALVRTLWRKCPLAICSGALRDEIEAMLEGIRLRDCFRVIVAAEDVKVGKPDPQGYVLAMRMLGELHHKSFKPETCLVVEDAPAVIRSARNAGFQTLGIASTYPASKLTEATFVVKDLLPASLRAASPLLDAMTKPAAG